MVGGIMAKAIKETLKLWRSFDWPKKVVDRMGFLLYSKLEEEKKFKEKWEKKEYQRLKRKYEG